MLKKAGVILLATLSTLTIALPVSAQEVQYDPIAIVQPRFSVISDVECRIIKTGSKALTVETNIFFTRGTTCKVNLKLLRNGQQVKAWSRSSMSGSICDIKDFSELEKGKYTVSLTYTAGSDKGNYKSNPQTL